MSPQKLIGFLLACGVAGLSAQPLKAIEGVKKDANLLVRETDPLSAEDELQHL
jgi:hypothetical protein